MRKALLIVSLLSFSQAFSEDVPKVQVTATRVPVPIEHVGDDVDVITHDEIERLGFTSIADVLKYLPGIEISNTGGFGKQTSVFMMGLDSRDVLVLLNGVPINDPSNPNGAANFEWIDLNNVERIEVLKGSQSALYGSEAVGGVINIITKRPKRSHVSMDLEGGKYRTFKESLSGSKVFNNGFISLSSLNFKTLGFSATNEKAGKYMYNPDHDPFHFSTGSFSFGYRPTNKLNFTGNFLDKGGYSNFDNGQSPDRSTYNRYLVDFGVNFLQSNKLSWDLKLSNNKETRDYPFGNYIGITRYAYISPTYRFSDSAFLKTGLSYRHEIANTNLSGNGIKDKRFFIRSAFVEGYTNIYGLNLIGTLRLDDHKNFGSHKTYKVSASHTFKWTGTTLKAQYGTSFKSPTLDQLYGYYNYGYLIYKGNPNLNPEKSEGWITGITQNLPYLSGKVGVNYFKNHVWDIVDSYYDTSLKLHTYRNVNKAISEGTELKLRFKPFKHIDVFGSYTHVRSKERREVKWQDRMRVPKSSFNLGFNLRHSNLSFSAWEHHYGRRKDMDYSSWPSKIVNLHGFTTYNCYASYELSKKIKLYVKGINLSNKHYELAYGYNTMGRAVFFGLKLEFK
ncbi:MAG: TonB-dependent receptor [Nitrospiraceae bacterium]|nr:TonB-dependent receptor [Nitrospiraceae bacterium]